MELFHDHIFLSRLQFAFTAMFHIIWPVLTIGLSIFLLATETLWLVTREDRYYHHTRFWMRLFLLNFAVGVVSGIPMEFQFGTNWGNFSHIGGDIFGHLLGFEASMAFMLEATFLGIMAFGWKRVPPLMHLFATAMVAFGGSLSAFWIMAANSWMQTPVGATLHEGRYLLEDTTAAIFNPDAYWSISHMWFACLEISLFVIGGISAWYLLRGRHPEFFLTSFKMMAAAAVIVAPMQLFLGDGSGKSVFHNQPAKLAAIEAHWQTNGPGEGAAWNVVAWPDKELQDNHWQIGIPYALSLITTHSPTGTVTGLREFPVDEQPPLLLTFYSFRIMFVIGGFLALLMLWTVWTWFRGRLEPLSVGRQKYLLYGWMAAAPLSYIAMEAGWITREVGRQPWVIQNVLKTGEGASLIAAETVAGSLLGFAAMYSLLFILFIVFARRILRTGPDLQTVPPINVR